MTRGVFHSVFYLVSSFHTSDLCSALSSSSSSLPQVQQSQEKIARLEQEKEHWLLEAQLGKVRLEKENQRIADLEAQLAAALGGSPNPPVSSMAGALTQSEEEADKELKAAGKEPTLCTSLVLNHVSTPRGSFVPMATVSDYPPTTQGLLSFLVAPTLFPHFCLIKLQASNALTRQKRRIPLFMQVGAEFTVLSQSRAACVLAFISCMANLSLHRLKPV